MPTPSASLALNSSFPDGLNSEKYDSPPQLTNRSPFYMVPKVPRHGVTGLGSGR